VSHRCLAGCCPHACNDLVPSAADDVDAGSGCPQDIPHAPLPERIAHLYGCQGLSTYRIAEVVDSSRQRVTRALHRAGVPIKPRGSGRRRLPRGAGAAVPSSLLADLYLRHRLTCGQISDLTQVPARTVQDRLRAHGVRLRTRGRFNREDRLAVEPEVLAEAYLRDGLTSEEVGKLLGVSRGVVLRSAHDEGLPVRMGGPAPSRGPTEIELITALYADADVQRALARHGMPSVPPGGPIWQRFPVPARLSQDLAEELYVSCGIGVHHIELLTGQPADTVRKLLHATGVTLRPPGGRSPFMRRWRASRAG
jgi:transposase InsO family protein